MRNKKERDSRTEFRLAPALAAIATTRNPRERGHAGWWCCECALDYKQRGATRSSVPFAGEFALVVRAQFVRCSRVVRA